MRIEVIGHLPTPYPDELLYSIIARYGQRMKYTSGRAVVEDMFGRGTVIAVVDLPANLQQFVRRLPPGHPYTVEVLIKNHTLLPWYAPFLPSERLLQLQTDMAGERGPAIQMRVGAMASRVRSPIHLRYCPVCVQTDRQQFGETYWHRVHQVAGVLVCPNHQQWLVDSDVNLTGRRTRYEYVAAEAVLPPNDALFSNGVPSALLVALACDASWLLKNQPSGPGLAEIRRRYQMLLATRDLATYTGSVRAVVFQQQFLDTYSPALLAQLQCEFTWGSGDNWLLRLVRSRNVVQHPLYRKFCAIESENAKNRQK